MEELEDTTGYNPAQLAEIELEKAQKEYEDIIEKFKGEDEHYYELLKEKRGLEDRLEEIKTLIRGIETNRFKQRADIKRAERNRDAKKIELEESMRRIKLNESRKEFYKSTADEMRAAEFEWTKFAYPHQWAGALTLAHFGSGILGDDMGTGKTITSIMALDMLKAKKVLVVCPPDVVSGFFDGIQMFAPHRNVVPLESANPTMRKMASEIAKTSSEITFVTNYQALWNDSSWVDSIEWDVLITDEAHEFKNSKGLSFDRLSGIKRKHTFPMTATSILNSPEDIWTSLHLVDPEIFNDKWAFLTAYCRTNDNGKWIFQPGGEAMMLKNLGGRIVKRSLEETGIKLPTQHHKEILIPFADVSERQKEVIKQLNDFASIALESGESASIDAMIALITRQRQSVVYPAGIHIKATEKDCEYNPNLEVGQTILKVPADMPSVVLDKAVERLLIMKDNGKRSVVFSQFKGALIDLQKRLEEKGMRVARYDGDTKKPERLRIKRDFLLAADGKRKTDYTYDVVLAHYKTGGVGLTFTEATYMLCIDEEWNPAKNRQAWARIHRIGQTEETLVETIRVEKTVSMWLKTVNDQKRLIVEGLDEQVNMLESYKEYVAAAGIDMSQKPAINAPVVEEEILEGEIISSEDIEKLHEDLQDTVTPMSIEAPKTEQTTDNGDEDILSLLAMFDDEDN